MPNRYYSIQNHGNRRRKMTSFERSGSVKPIVVMMVFASYLSIAHGFIAPSFTSTKSFATNDNTNDFRHSSSMIMAMPGKQSKRSKLKRILFKSRYNRYSMSLSASEDNDEKGNEVNSKGEVAKSSEDKNLEPENDPEEPNKMKTKFLAAWNVILTRTLSAFPTIKVALASFVTGIVLSGALILVPVYNSVDKMTEPVTLFETILADLDQGYVDDVDTKKLFETGVSAMLQSLDPYTEFEGRQEAQDLNESVSGKYGGIGLVITGAVPAKQEPTQVDVQSIESPATGNEKILPKDALQDNQRLEIESSSSMIEDDEDLISADEFEREDILQDKINQKKAMKKAMDKGIRVVSAFEGYSFDYGMRPGDKIVAVDDWRVTPGTSVESVRNRLRGEAGSTVDITFERDGVQGENTVTVPRTIVQIRDVKLASLIGKAENGMGYIQLSGFTSDAGREVRQAIFALQQAAEEASNGQNSLKGLVLDLRGNPGGLLTSAVDVSSLLVPKGSEIVSARGRGFPGVTYKSRVDPILDPKTKLAVLINGQTASAAEIVSGAIQDLDVGVIVGNDRSFGKGLVQNVEELPFNTALKFTVAKYYTPSGRCIQSTNYKEGGKENDGKYQASKVADKDKMTFYTKNGREVKDGGGIKVDFKVDAPKASALEVTLIRSGVLTDFASEWSKKHQLTNNFDVDDNTYREFQSFVLQKQKEGDVNLDALYRGPIEDLKRALKRSGYKGSSKELDQLQASIQREVEKDFDKYKKDIKEDIGNSILSRYLPESMLIKRSIESDKQVLDAVKLLNNDNEFNKLLARSSFEPNDGSKVMASSTHGVQKDEAQAKLGFKW